MSSSEISRLSRLTAILLQLQSRRMSTSTALAERFNVSVRTIYRDIRALEDAGVPVIAVEGKGYKLMEGYTLPPVSFTERQANALITAEQLVMRNRDASFVQDYAEAIVKIKAVLQHGIQHKTELLSDRLVVGYQPEGYNCTSNNLSVIQLALTNFNLLRIDYQAADPTARTSRIIEPFALYSSQDNWVLIAFCRLRAEFRSFRLDRVKHLVVLDEKFQPHQLTLAEYFEEWIKKSGTP